eukprot:scaffold1501_cov158-Amphora_coffeaeformis.AAC.5
MSFRRISLSLIVVINAWLTSLVVLPVAAFRGPLNLTTNRPQRRLLSTRQATVVANGQDVTERNIYYNSDKPLLLVGYSSEDGDEVARLAQDLQASYLSSAGQVLSLADLKTVKEDLQWPDVLYLDLSQSIPDDLETFLGEWHADASTLNVLVNVQDSGKKKDVEDSVLVPFTDYEICIKDEGKNDNDKDGWDHIVWELARLVARARLIPPIPGDKERTNNCAHLTMGDHTFFLSLSFPKVTDAEEYIAEMCLDVDALEYRTDLLECRDSRFELLYGMQLLRRYSRPNVVRVPGLPFGPTVLEDVMPIVYTVRTQNQAGTYPDDEAGIQRMFELLDWGLRGGVEVLDVESAWDSGLTKNLLDKAQARYSSQILGSHHIVGKSVSTEEAVLLFEQCALQGRAHAAKVVLSIEKEEQDRMAYEAALITSELARAEGEPVIPKIALILGEVGQFSRVINLPFTPVTHERLPVAAAPGQMTAMEIMTTRLLTQIFARKKYAILGHNIAYSVSPQMHGAAFRATKLPHEYLRVDVETVEEFIESDLFKSDDFGGTSITIPHKQSIIPYVDVLSESAKTIGSVNTLVVKEEYFNGGDGEDLDDPDESQGEFRRVIYGDNTDWKGIYNPLNRILGGSIKKDADVCLILGAGGTARAAAFVAKKLGLKIIYYNRTPEKAADLVSSFGGSLALSLEAEGDDSLGSLLEQAALKVVISTLPAAAEFELPTWILEKEEKGQLPVVFDVNYKPYNTKLLLQAEAAGCSLVRGSEMLWEQGVGQFELWTGRTAPYAVMKTTVLQNCLPKEDEKDKQP